MKKLSVIIIILAFCGCVKDKLKDDKSLFVGNWNWVYTNAVTGLCDSIINTTVLTPVTENFNYSLEFLEKGKVKIYKDGEIIYRGRSAFSYWEVSDIDSESYNFIILVNNKYKNRIEGSVKGDTIRLQRSFFYENDTECYSSTVLENGCCQNNCYYLRI